MMQSLLADRFKLALHFETHDVPVTALVQVKSSKLGPRLGPHSQGSACDAKIPPVDRNSPKNSRCLAAGLRKNPGDRLEQSQGDTGFAKHNLGCACSIYSYHHAPRPARRRLNRFDREIRLRIQFHTTLESAQEASSDTQLDLSGPTLLEATKDQFGLELTPAKPRIQYLIIDHVEEPSPT